MEIRKARGRAEAKGLPSSRPVKSHQKLGLIFVRQQNAYRPQKTRQSRLRPKRSANGPINVPNSTLAPNPTMYLLISVWGNNKHVNNAPVLIKYTLKKTYNKAMSLAA